MGQQQQMMQQMLFQQQQSQQQQKRHQLLSQQQQQQHGDDDCEIPEADNTCKSSHLYTAGRKMTEWTSCKQIHSRMERVLAADSGEMPARAEVVMAKIDTTDKLTRQCRSKSRSKNKKINGVDENEKLNKNRSVLNKPAQLPEIALNIEPAVVDGGSMEMIPEIDPCDNENELLDAVQARNAPLAMAILKRPGSIEVNRKNRQGQTALHVAACAGLADVCMSILERPDFTEVNARCSDGRTALHVAAQALLSDLCMVILSRPDFTEVNAVDISGKTALHTAAGVGLDEVCLAIIKTSGFSEMNAVDLDGQTVLHVAASAGLREVCLPAHRK